MMPSCVNPKILHSRAFSVVSVSLLSRDQESKRINPRSSRPNETIVIAIRLTNGEHGTLNISKLANVKPEVSLEVYGEGGSIRSKTGAGLRWQYFLPVITALAARWHVYALDSCGHGQSHRS